MKAEYIVARGKYEEFYDEVSQFVEQGFFPQGGVVVIRTTSASNLAFGEDDVTIFYQALFREGDDEDA